jgi:phage terminase large subunit-like protein
MTRWICLLRRDNWKPSKKRSLKRIDGIVALIMAAGRASLANDPSCSAYDDPDFRPMYL